MLLTAAGITVLSESQIGPDPCTRRIQIRVYEKGIITGGKIGEINTNKERKI